MINVNSNHKISHFCTTQLWEAQKYFVSKDIQHYFVFKKGEIVQEENHYLQRDQFFVR